MNFTKKKPIGIFGGSFDPPHVGHLKIANFCIKKLKLQSLFWLVAKKNPFKKKPFLSLKKRILLSKNLTKKNNKIKVKYLDDLINSSRTIKVVTYLRRKNKNNDLYFIIGSDSLINFHKWDNSKKIIDLVKLVIFPRTGYDKRAKNSAISRHLNVKNSIFLKSNRVNISSSQLRKNYL